MLGDKMLHLCGLGAHPPEETTLETLLALERSPVVYCDVLQPSLLRWLKPYCRRLVPLEGKDVRAEAARVLRESQESAACVAVWGHPMISSPLCLELLRCCRSLRRPVKVLGAVSPIGSAFARSNSFLGGYYGFQGIQAMSLEAIEGKASVKTALPLVVYASSPDTGGGWGRVLTRLRGLYPQDHAARVFGTGSGRAAGKMGTLREIAGKGELGRVVLFVPPVGGGERPGA